jgi:hypothetical protein
MKDKTEKYLKLAIENLKSARSKYIANATGNQIFDFQINAKKHYEEYNETIEYFEKLLEEKHGVSKL